MDPFQEKMEKLSEQINVLANAQTNLSRQLIELINELEALKKAAGSHPAEPAPAAGVEINRPPSFDSAPPVVELKTATAKPAVRLPIEDNIQKKNSSLEEFIGGNIASKVGILVTLIGIFIGSRYAIEHNLVNPTVRVLLGYLAGVTLVVIAWRLRAGLSQYSAVLMGGGLSTLYFITYVAYGVYDMLPQPLAFILMLLITGATVYAALLYNLAIIAHLAQVGAYAIPFILSDNSGRYGILFSYIAIINTGILVLSFLRYWKSLYHAAFIITWLIFLAWTAMEYDRQIHFNLAISFAAIYFLIFYVAFLAYKLVKKEEYGLRDVFLLLSNAFIFYGIGYEVIEGQHFEYNPAGLFTILNAVAHFGIGLLLMKRKMIDKSLVYLLLGLGIVFLSIAIPVQFNGNWVTLLWTAEGLLLFVIGRKRQSGLYEKLAVGLVILGIISLLQDWFAQMNQFSAGQSTRPFLNMGFVTGLFSGSALYGIVHINRGKHFESGLDAKSLARKFFDYSVPVLLILVCYAVPFVEIQGWFARLSFDRAATIVAGELENFNFIFDMIYSIGFMLALSAINNRRIRNVLLGTVLVFINLFTVVVMLGAGFPAMNRLGMLYFGSSRSQLYFGAADLLTRYLSILVLAIFIWFSNQFINNRSVDRMLKRSFTIMGLILMLGAISFEYLFWMQVAGATNQDKLGLSIIWGVFALVLVLLGVRNKQKHWRMLGIVLFIITLIKLFLYDIAMSTTLSKTVTFIALGVMLLLVSYVYNRYKHIILMEDEDEQAT